MADPQPLLQPIADHLHRRRKGILEAWRQAVLRDPSLTTGNALPRAALNDHVPSALAAFEQQLHRLATGAAASPDDVQTGADAATAHGMHRWQQGYDLREVTRELGHLNGILVAELDAYAAASSDAPATLALARQAWAAACSASIEESTSQFFRLQRLEAEGHVKDLERTMAEVAEVERQRAELWLQLAHDLRGNVGVVATATRVLSVADLPPDSRDRYVRMLERNVESLRHLLDDVTSLTRLQAGKEERQVAPFDASQLFVQLCDGLQALAQERGLYLRAHAPAAPLQVRGDAVKVRRLAQNLVINALKYTRSGGVDVQWAGPATHDDQRWRFSVKDSGPGLHAGPGAPLASALQAATSVADTSTAAGDAAAPGLPPAPLDARPTQQAGGEGIGLSIVKRLAELLDATVEVASAPERGTTFTILLPVDYPD